MSILLSIKKSLGGEIITLCDKELLGRTLEFNGIKLTINEFYNGKEIQDSDIDNKLFDNAISIHAIGEKSVNVLKKLGIVSDKDIEFFDNIPIVLLFYV